MKTTIFGDLLDVTPDQDTVLRRLMRNKYGFMLRFAFQRLGGGLQNIKDPIVKTIFLRIFRYSTADVDGKIGSVFGARASSMVSPFPPTLRAR